MSRYTGPRRRIMRALGTDLPGLSAKTIDGRPHPPGQHGPRTRRKISLYGTRLREKQKLRLHYRVSERQLRAAAEQASRSAGPVGGVIAQLLDRRPDNIVFRAGFARTIPAARQLVSHGHVRVHGKVLDIPSARVQRGDAVTIATRAHAAVAQQRAAGDNRVDRLAGGGRQRTDGVHRRPAGCGRHSLSHQSGAGRGVLLLSSCKRPIELEVDVSAHNCREPKARDEWGVMQCECGMLRVKLGTVVLEFEPADVLRLIDLLNRAVDHFAIAAPSEGEHLKAH